MTRPRNCTYAEGDWEILSKFWFPVARTDDIGSKPVPSKLLDATVRVLAEDPAMKIWLYPKPLDPEAFEARYHGQHMPLMRELVGPDRPLPTFRILGGTRSETPFYQIAEIHLPTRKASSPLCGRTMRPAAAIPPRRARRAAILSIFCASPTNFMLGRAS